jgi:hypothetical protein|tara:strand:+ start:111 stop:323 length:213 start_codon:yes stop_codon:yes gene_type:complete
MPTVNNWEEWDDIEDKSQDEIVREKVTHKTKTHNKKDWEKINERLQSDNGVKFVKNKRREAHKDSNHHLS